MTYTDAIEAITYRVQRILDTVGSSFPFVSDPETGEWETTANGNWCPGHWIGLLWLTAQYLPNREESKRCQNAARQYTEAAGWSDLTGSVFAGMNYRYAGFRARDIYNDQRLIELGLRGATHVRDSFDESAKIVPVGSFGTRGLERHSSEAGNTTAAVDAIYTAIGPLWRAAAVSGDARYLEIARQHVDTHCRWFVRDDGAVWHKVSFHPDTKTVKQRYNQLTQVPDSCWARGLGWSIAGLVDAYNATKDTDYLSTLNQHVDYYSQWTPPDDVPFAEIGPNVPMDYRDTSAAALVAYGLVRLPDDDPHTVALQKYGCDIVTTLITDYLIANGASRGQLREGCYNAVDDIATNHELVWATYYLLVALLVIHEPGGSS